MEGSNYIIFNYNSRNLLYLQCGRHKLDISRNSYVTLCYSDVTGNVTRLGIFQPH